MSNPLPPPPPPSLPSTSHHHHHQPPYITTPTTSTNREYRKGNWTIQETLTLITAKRIDDERRARPSTSPPSKPGELRWKWIENYCWDHGCFRSQNQCNDKWDNLLRDYKKVRQYQSSSSSQQSPSYWSMDRHQRKLHNLPTTMSPEVFEALNDVLQRKYTTHQQQPPSVSQSPEQLAGKTDRQAPEIEAPVTISEETDSSETESSENLDSETKRKKVRKIGSSIMRSASVLARTLKSCEENKEKRHQQVMELEHRRLRIEETQNEVNHKGMTDLVAATTNLSGAIQSLIANHCDKS
ncbi:UBX domain-containing protein isoform 1 [Hibiscus syriacus]|uniref:UBX domain-containing protein isoform 1 n=1 Tax=Hibiscus syriacus TaxID=106335 RepID=A0A6A3B2K2_HIBSY|nr:trihelix transcription factor ASR3-like [Hibiscus syriacus]KAE8710108.1 UBX domain-containing protein isoform 1 [Hibiscus syriacus]